VFAVTIAFCVLFFKVVAFLYKFSMCRLSIEWKGQGEERKVDEGRWKGRHGGK